MSDEALEVYRHSAAHLLAHAVTELFPDVQYGIGPAVENGFYYDFLTAHPFTPEDLLKISKKMKQMVKQNLKISKNILDVANGILNFSVTQKIIKFMTRMIVNGTQ